MTEFAAENKICDPNAEFERNDFSSPLETLPELFGVSYTR